MNKKAIATIFLLVFVDLVGFGIIIPLSPYLARKFAADELQIGWLMAIYSLMQFLFAPIWGGLSDRYGRRPILLLSLAGSVIGHAIFAFAGSFTVLFIGRLFAGICGANISTAMAYMADMTAEKDRSKGMGLIGAAFGLGFLLGPVLGGVFGHIGEQLGNTPPWGPSFSALAASGICLVNFLMAFVFLKESRPLEERTSQKKSDRLKRMALALSTPVMGSLIGIYFLSSLGMALMETTLFMYMDDKFQWDYKTASYGFAYVGLILVFTQGYLIRRVMPLFGEAKVMAVGLFLALIGLFEMGFATQIWQMALAVTALGLGVGLLNPALTGAVSLLANRQNQGATMGVTHSVSALARIVGPPTGGLVYRDLGRSLPFYISGSMMLLGLIVVLLIFSTIPRKGLDANE